MCERNIILSHGTGSEAVSVFCCLKKEMCMGTKEMCMGTKQLFTVNSQAYNEAVEKSNALLRPPSDLSNEEITSRYDFCPISAIKSSFSDKPIFMSNGSSLASVKLRIIELFSADTPRSVKNPRSDNSA